jgi:hypothetical protein
MQALYDLSQACSPCILKEAFPIVQVHLAPGNLEISQTLGSVPLWIWCWSLSCMFLDFIYKSIWIYTYCVSILYVHTSCQGFDFLHRYYHWAHRLAPLAWFSNIVLRFIHLDTLHLLFIYFHCHS